MWNHKVFGLFLIVVFHSIINLTGSTSEIPPSTKIDAVVLTTGKDTRTFFKSIRSALEHLIDVDKYYVICPNIQDIEKSSDFVHNPRIIFVDESKFPFKAENVADIMIDSVKWRGLYPLDNGRSQFERTVYGRIGWFLQQLLKFYAGKVIGLKNYVILDSDIVWFKDVKFINNSLTNTYNYASSSQYHTAYMATLKKISGVDLLDDKGPFRSGIVHHIVIVQEVLDELMRRSEAKHSIPFWQVLLNVSALELTCRAPKTSLCGGQSTLSEYELYFNFARSIFPSTVNIRPLLWTNGPAPHLLFWPQVTPSVRLSSDGLRGNWLAHRQNQVKEVMEKQTRADQLQGYDFVAYHSYAKRRYYEIVGVDAKSLCDNAPLPYPNSTCSWRGYNADIITGKSDHAVDEVTWFQGCACYMMMHPS